MTRARRLELGLSVLIGALLCAPSALIPLYRSFYQRNFPEHAAAWPNDGPFTHFAVYGGEGEDEAFYAARAREAGRRLPAYDPYIKEDRSARLLSRDLLGFAALGAIQRLTGDLDLTWPLARLIFAALFFLLLLALLRSAGARDGPSLFSAAVLTLFFEITVELVGFEAPLSALKAFARKSLWLLGGEHNFFGPTRLLNPAISYPALLAAGLLLLRAERGKAKEGVLAGAAGGLLAYVHTNVWMAWCLGAALFWGERSLRARRIHKPLLAAGLCAAALSLPWLALNVPPDPDVLLRSAAVFERRFSALSLFYFAAAAWLWRRGRVPALSWCAAMCAATGLALNMSLAAGYRIVDYEWAFLGNLFLLSAAAALAGARAADGPRWRWLTALACLAAFARAASYSAHLYRSYGIPSTYAQAFRWLEENAAPDSVVAALSGEVTLLLPVHAGTKTLVARNQPLVSDVSTEENARRLAYALELFVPPARRRAAAEVFLSGATEDLLTGQMWTGEIDRARLDLHPSDILFSGFGHRNSRDAVRGKVAAALAAPTEPYAVDYLWFGPLERKLAGPGFAPPCRDKVFDNGAVAIYR